MSEAPVASTPTSSHRARGCLLRALVAIAVVVALVIVVGYAFDQGENARQPAHGYHAGRTDAYARATVTYLEQTHIFLTRLQDGSFVALYDRSTKQQELGGDCRLVFDDTQGVGTLDPLPGITGALVEECTSARAVWRADGKFSFGAGYGDLDRFDTKVEGDGDLIIDTGSRTCTRSRGVIGVPPFDRKRCGSPD